MSSLFILPSSKRERKHKRKPKERAVVKRRKTSEGCYGLYEERE